MIPPPPPPSAGRKATRLSASMYWTLRYLIEASTGEVKHEQLRSTTTPAPGRRPSRSTVSGQSVDDQHLQRDDSDDGQCTDEARAGLLRSPPHALARQQVEAMLIVTRVRRPGGDCGGGVGASSAADLALDQDHVDVLERPTNRATTPARCDRPGRVGAGPRRRGWLAAAAGAIHREPETPSRPARAARPVGTRRH